MIPKYFYEIGKKTIQALEVPDGVLASSNREIYGCIFGRDSLITALKLLSAYEIDRDPYYLALTRKVLEGLIRLQGKDINIESGEEPGKCIHEFRTGDHERLTKAERPWFVYPDGTLRNFDSVDATPLFLIALYNYQKKSRDIDFIKSHKKNLDLALSWIFDYGDKNGDGFIDYEMHPERKSGGLTVQSWMDSAESVFHEDDVKINFPVAPVEAQSYTYLALKLWARYFSHFDKKMSDKLLNRAKKLKVDFNERFILRENKRLIFAHALDNLGKPLISGRSSIGHILWASHIKKDNELPESILDSSCVKPLVRRLMKPDLFEPKAGIRTLSNQSRLFDPFSYHNGSIWPHDNSLIAEGMAKFGFKKEADKIRRAIFRAYRHFQTPIELFAFQDKKYLEYQSASGQTACREQAWSAASMIADALALRKTGKKS